MLSTRRARSASGCRRRSLWVETVSASCARRDGTCWEMVAVSRFGVTFFFVQYNRGACCRLGGSSTNYQGCVRYGTYRGIPAVYTVGITGTGHFGKFGTTSISVPDTSVCSVRHQYRHRTLRYVRSDINTGTENTGTVPNTPLVYYNQPISHQHDISIVHTLDPRFQLDDLGLAGRADIFLICMICMICMI